MRMTKPSQSSVMSQMFLMIIIGFEHAHLACIEELEKQLGAEKQ